MLRLRRCRIRQCAIVAGFLCGLFVCGCAGDSDIGPTYPVTGQITLDGEPLTDASTVVLFKPDTAKGNARPYEPIGTVDGQGTYRLSTKGKNGAPPGWYKVVVTARESRPEHPKTTERQKPAVKSLLPAKYGQATTTNLRIEVVESPAPGAYDLTLSR